MLIRVSRVSNLQSQCVDKPLCGGVVKTLVVSCSNVPRLSVFSRDSGGATESFVRTLTSSSINMDMDTFIALDQSVIQVS